MATTKKKTRKTAKRGKTTKGKRRITARLSGKKPNKSKVDSIEMEGDRLVVRISKETHPEIFEIDRLIKQIDHIQKTYGGKAKTADLCEFLIETRKSLTIILTNHLEDALRQCLA